jgi:hypothetical protein
VYGPQKNPANAAAAEGSDTNPQVIRVDVPAGNTKWLRTVFSANVNAASLIANGSITSAARLVNLATGPLALTAGQFGYDTGTRALTLTLNSPLANGTYELRLDGSQFRDATDQPLIGGQGGLAFPIPTFAAATLVQAAGADLKVDSYSVPALADWNQDGVTDLIVGEKTTAGQGQVRVYLNTGTDAAPVLGTPFYAQANGADLAVPGGGCLGVFPGVVDWNGDGNQDLVLGLANGTVQVALNENTAAEPRFGMPQPVQVGEPDAKADIDVGDRTTLAVVDWNNDGRQDLILGALDGKVRVLLNVADSGPPDFRAIQLVQDGTADLADSSGRSSVAVVDLNGDGRKDLVLGNTDGQLRFFANVGTDAAPQFAGSQLLQAAGATIDLDGTPRSRPVVAAVNGDDVPDLLVGSLDGTVRLYVGAAGTAPAPATGPAGGTYVHAFRVPAAGSATPWQCPLHPLDVNHDGRLTPLDALVVINYLNASGSQALPVPPTATWTPPPYLDCTGDGNVTPLDVLQVINDQNASGPRLVPDNCDTSPTCVPEGEASAPLLVLATPTNTTANRSADSFVPPASRGELLVAKPRRLSADTLQANGLDLEDVLAAIAPAVANSLGNLPSA